MRSSKPRNWPSPLREEAFIGLAGEITRAIEPISEADPAAVLVQLLTVFGNAVGYGPHFRAEADQHGLNLFTLIVGETAKARKGTSWGHVRALMKLAEPEWSSRAINNGLSSAEGLISLVSDPTPDAVAQFTPRRDKRAMIVETEFASVLAVMTRHGNTLSEVVRNAWDGNQLQTITKQSPLISTEHHISIIGHVTAEEFRAKLNKVETSNGFLNRFVMVLSSRSKVLPEGGELPADDAKAFAAALARTIAKSREIRVFRRDPEARARWAAVYPALSEGHTGLFGGAVSRAEAQVVRLACVYAALDCAPLIGKRHLEAALAIWRYAEESAAMLFEGRFGNATANEIHGELRQRPDGMTKTDIHRFLSNHGKQGELDAVLESLVDYDVVHCIEEATGGRPATRWFAK